MAEESDKTGFSDEALFSRTSHNGEELGELRGNCPTWILGVLAAAAKSESEATGNRVSQTAIAVRVLSKWAQDEVNRATLINRVLKDYPTVREGGGND